jgi:peptidoglycan/LPS O-acetylase OafA/YrhL
LVLLELIGGVTRYVLWPSVVAVLCAGLVVFGTSREARVRRPFAANHLSAWKAVAVSAYSAYLIHPLAIHVARRIAAIGGPDFWLLYWPVVAALIGLATLVLYISVESPSIVLRDAPKTRIRRWNSRSSHVGEGQGRTPLSALQDPPGS